MGRARERQRECFLVPKSSVSCCGFLQQKSSPLKASLPHPASPAGCFPHVARCGTGSASPCLRSASACRHEPPLFRAIPLAISAQFTSHVQEQADSVPGLHPEADRKKSPKIRTPKIGIRSSFVPLMDVASVFGASDPKCL